MNTHPLMQQFPIVEQPEPSIADMLEGEEALPAPADRGWERPWQRTFLASLSSLPDVSAACRIAGIGRKQVYRVRDADPDFDRAWNDALDLARDAVERRAYQWIMTGVPVKKTVTKKKMKGGVVVEEETTTTESAETNATLMIFWLKAHFPDRYRWSERAELTGAEGGPIRVEGLDSIDRQIAELSAELEQRARQTVAVAASDDDGPDD